MAFRGLWGERTFRVQFIGFDLIFFLILKSLLSLVLIHLSSLFPLVLHLMIAVHTRTSLFRVSDIDLINSKARYNKVDAKYRQMALQSVPTNPYLESLAKQNWCKFRGLCLHSTSVVILPYYNYFQWIFFKLDLSESW